MNRNEKLNVISYLRILACLLVLFGHYSGKFTGPAILGVFVPVGPVVIFFVISGFLAYYSLYNNSNIKKYYWQRIRKIIPSYYVILIICVLFMGITGEMRGGAGYAIFLF